MMRSNGEQTPLLSHRQGALRSHILLDHNDQEVTDRFSVQNLRRSLNRSEDIPSAVHGAPQDHQDTKETLLRLKRMAGFEGQDFDPIDNDLERDFALHRSEQDYAAADAWRWILSIIIGLVMGGLAFLVDWGIEALNSYKYQSLRDAVNMSASTGGGFLMPYFVFVATSLGYAFIAGAIVAFIEPLAAGSGIPEVKTYLNGIHIRGLLTVKTLIAKLTGVVWSIGAGLIAGKEGPFVHGGGIVGGGIGGMGSMSITEWSGWRSIFKAPRNWGGYFRNSADHRDFTAIGTAAGVATAFAAPIGGLLFCIEEGVSFYSMSIFWRGFLATSVGVLTLHILVDIKDHPGHLMATKFGRFRDFGLYTDSVAMYGSRMYYRVWDLPVFCLMGALAGLLGALFVAANIKVTQLRHQHGIFKSKWRRLLEVLVLAAVTTTLWFTVSYLSPCAQLPSQDDLRYLEAIGDGFSDVNEFLGGGGDAEGVRGLEHFPRLWCPAGKYSRWGQIFMVPLSQALRLIMHLGEPLPETRPQFQFDEFAVFLLFTLTFAIMCWTNGVGASTGMFVPSLAVGAAGGRLIGRAVQLFVNTAFSGTQQYTVSLTSYAVIGAAAFLSGATRMTLTATVMVMETTGALQLIVPIMLAVFFAKIVGDRFGVGIDDTHIRLRGAPVLEEAGVDVTQQMIDDKLTVSELMCTSVITLPPVVRVKKLVETLRVCNHQAFPVTPETDKALAGNGESFELHGVILRSTLLSMLRSKLGLVPSSSLTSGGITNSTYNNAVPGRASVAANNNGPLPGEVQSWIPPTTQSGRLQALESLQQIPIKVRNREHQDSIIGLLTPADLEGWIDLRPFMQRAPFAVAEDAGLARAYRLFRTLGLRHMFITPAHPQVIGMVTRKDIITDNAKLALGRKANLGLFQTSDASVSTAERMPLPTRRRRNPLPFIPYSAYDPTTTSETTLPGYSAGGAMPFMSDYRNTLAGRSSLAHSGGSIALGTINNTPPAVTMVHTDIERAGSMDDDEQQGLLVHASSTAAGGGAVSRRRTMEG